MKQIYQCEYCDRVGLKEVIILCEQSHRKIQNVSYSYTKEGRGYPQEIIVEFDDGKRKKYKEEE